MNFYKEQDSPAMNKTNYRDVTNRNKTVHIHPSFPNVSYPNTFQTTNKQNVERNVHQNMPNVKNSQVRKNRYKRDDISIFPVCDPPKPIKHNLPIVIQSDRKSYVANKPNILKDVLSSSNLGGFTSSDNLFKKPEIPVAASNCRNILSEESTRYESIRGPGILKNKPSKILVEATGQLNNDRPINLSNNNNRATEHQQNVSTIDLDNKLDKNLKIYEESLKIILALSKENKDVILETYMTIITELYRQIQGNSQIDRYRVLKLAKTTSDIIQAISSTVAKALQQMYDNKSIQTEIANEMEYTSLSTVFGNIAAKQNQTNNITVDRNKDCYNLQQQQRSQQIYQQQNLRNQNNLHVDKTTNVVNCETKTQKNFSQGRDTDPFKNQTQNILPHTSSNLQQQTAQYDIMNEQRNYQQNYNVQRERVQFQQYRNPNTLNPEQQRYEHGVASEEIKTNPNEGVNRNMPSVIDDELGTVYGQHERDYLQRQVTNDKESQKRKSSYARGDFTIFLEGPKHNKRSTVDVSELPKRQRYEDASINWAGMNDMLSTHKSDVEIIPTENIPKEFEVTEIPRKNIIISDGDKDKISNEIYNLDDEEDKRLTINEESFKAIFSLSERNKSLLMKNYVSHISEMEKLTQKYGDSDTNNLENNSKKMAHVFQAIIEKLVKSYQTNKLELKTQTFDKHAQTVMQNETEYVGDERDSPIIVVNPVQNPINDATGNVNEGLNISHMPNCREMYGYQPSYPVFQEYRNQPNQNPNQAQVREHKTFPTVSNAPFSNRRDPRLNRQQMSIPAEHERSYGMTSTPATHMLPLQVHQQQLQFANINEQQWNFEQNNRTRINNEPTQNIDQFQQYQAQMMMHHQNMEQQRYYQMQLQRNNAWAAQTGDYPRNDWN